MGLFQTLRDFFAGPPKRRDPPGIRCYVKFDSAGKQGEVARAVHAHLQATDLPVDDVVEEDWGDLIGVGKELLVCTGDREQDWLLYVCPPKGPEHPVADTPLLRQTLAEIDAALKSLPTVSNVRWQTAEEFDG